GEFESLTAPDGVISGAGGTFSGGSIFANAKIRNQSDLNLVINDISLTNGVLRPDVSLDAESLSLTFAVGNLAPGGNVEVEILNEGSGDVVIDGLIDNPIGLTRIENTGGNIVNGSAATDVVRSNTVELVSAGSIGAGARRLNVDLVRSTGRPTDFDLEAAGDVWLNLTGRLRDTVAANALFAGGTLDTTGEMDILFQSSLQETTSTGTAAGINVAVVPASSQVYSEFFTPDTNSGPAPLDYRLFADTSQAVTLGGGFDFELIRGSSIKLVADDPLVADPRVDLTANTDHGVSGTIHVITNGDVDLTEIDGTMRIATTVSSANGGVTLSAAAIDSRSGTISAKNNIAMTATGGDLTEGLITSTAGNITMSATDTIHPANIRGIAHTTGLYHSSQPASNGLAQVRGGGVAQPGRSAR
ncbi:MAG: hypothetical protein IID36_07670, partial [Planctomycetes bacterium]|nr:hypothetical protein [Planctomycetota bacterium]